MRKVNIDALLPLVEAGYLTARPHPSADLLIWNYTTKTQYEHYWTEETLMCRGLITTTDGEVVASPFAKFFNYEQHQDPIPLEPFKVTEKMDGSLAILYFVNGKPAIATRGSFTSEQAVKATEMLHTKYSNFPFSPDYTYLFEIIYPQNRVIVNYGDQEDLILLALIHTKTGQEYDIHDPARMKEWPFPVVKHYDGITDIVALRKVEEANREGFVIRFESGLRLKMKFAEYQRLHSIITQVNARIIWDYLRTNQPFDQLLDRVPDEFYTWVANTRKNLLEEFAAIEQECRHNVELVKDLPTRREQAAIVMKAPYSGPTFRMLDNKDYSEQIWKMLRPQAERPFRDDEA